MTSTIRLLPLMLVVAVGSASGLVCAADSHVVAQDLQKLRVPGKISSVVWTRRDDSFTLQVVLQMTTEFQLAAKIAGQRAAAGLPSTLQVPRLPRVQAWIMKLDGTIIDRNPGSPPFPAAITASDGVPLEVSYSFPLAAAQEAAAVAIMVDDAFYIEQLKPFRKDSN